MTRELKSATAITMGIVATLVGPLLTPTVSAQQRPGLERQQPPSRQQRQDWDWDGNYQRLNRINAGTFITVRTARSIESNRNGGVFSGVVADDVWDDYKRLSTAAIPQGSRVDLVVRSASDGDLVLDLQNIYAHGQRYAVNAQPQRVEAGARQHRDAGDTAEWVGGGAALGTIIGAIAGGGKGAAIGAGAGAATGFGALSFRGKSIKIPAGSLLTFRLNEGLDIRKASGKTYTQNREPSRSRR